MYPNFISDRKNLGYEVLRDTSCGIKLVLIFNSTVPRLLKPSKCKRQFVKKLSSKLNPKSKIVIVVLVSTLWFSNVQPAPAMGLSIPAAPVVRLQPSYRHSSEVKTAPTVSPKLDKITFIKYGELPVCIYMMDERFLKTPDTIRIINRIRGGSLIEAATALVVLVVMWQILGVGIEIEGFQFPIINPPIINPRGGVHRGGIQQHLNHPKHGGGIRVNLSKSNECGAHQTQVSSFVKNGKVDLNQAFSEVNRRASAIGCETFDCSFARFKELVTECGEIKESGVREAITILQGEMEGYYKNARRVDYGPNVKGLDFAVDGLGKFENITHAEAKNAVGSGIEIADSFDANIWKQGKKIGKKSVWQKRFWSNTSRTSEVPNLNSDAYLPESVNNTLTVVDCYDVPNFEKQTMNNAINFGAKNDTNLIILNNRTNI